MSQITLKGDKIELEGSFLETSQLAPEFVLVTKELENVTLRNYRGKKKILATLPSVDTSVCSQESKDLQDIALAHPEIVFLVISKDLPFSQDRFCKEAKLHNLIFLSDLRPSSLFGKNYGVRIMDGPLAGLLARSIIVLNEEDQVVYTELVPEVTQSPNFEELKSHL